MKHCMYYFKIFRLIHFSLYPNRKRVVIMLSIEMETKLAATTKFWLADVSVNTIYLSSIGCGIMNKCSQRRAVQNYLFRCIFVYPGRWRWFQFSITEIAQVSRIRSGLKLLVLVFLLIGRLTKLLMRNWF